jgi:thymidine kinase
MAAKQIHFLFKYKRKQINNAQKSQHNMKNGQIVFHYGCMASEKSLALIRDYRGARSVGEECLCYVPAQSKDGQYIISRFMAGEGNGSLKEIKIPATGVKSSEEIYRDVEAHVKKLHKMQGMSGAIAARLRLNVIIDEINLLDEGVKWVVEALSHNGIRVVCSGLDLDYRGEPFPLKGEHHITVPEIMGIATETHRHYARCSHLLEDGAPCGANATRSQRFKDTEHAQPSHYDDPLIEVDPGKYAPVCEYHHIVPGKPSHKKITDYYTE